ncbi:MAG: DNA polymerase III subunit delta [Candidatus Aminicenantes bacterium]
MDLSPAYFFYGEDVFPAFEFIEEIKEKISSPDQQDTVVERYELGTDSWADIIDSAKTMPLLSSSYRLIRVEIPPRKRQNIPRKEEQLSSADKELLKSYLSSPSEKTVLIIVFNQKIQASSPLLKFFRSLPNNSIHIEELALLKGKKLDSWIKKRIQEEGKNIDLYACKRLTELAGNDLSRLNNEIDKLVTFVGEKNFIKAEDVEQISGWTKPFIQWEITNSLEESNYQKCLFTLDKLLEKEDIPPVVIMNEISGFFNDILLTKMRLQEGSKDKKSIFKEIKPFIPERYKDLYQRKFKQIIHFAEQISVQDLRYYIEQLKNIDIKMKSTGLSFHELMDGFLFDYCQRRTGRKGLL